MSLSLGELRARMRTRGAPLLGLAPASSSDRNLQPTLSEVSVRLGHAIETFRVAEIFRPRSSLPAASYKGAEASIVELNRMIKGSSKLNPPRGRGMPCREV